MKNTKRGFTLLELLIVVAIIGALSVIIIFLLDPTETLKKSRDVQRMSDLGTLKTALGIYLTSSSSPVLGTVGGIDRCKIGTGAGSYGANSRIFYSVASSSATITDVTLDGSAASSSQVATIANSTVVDGTGWIPVNLDGLSGGSPISSLPLDPMNTINDVANIASSSLAYRYVCNSTSKIFEIDAVLESTAYTTDDNKSAKDGGNNTNYYEVGNNIKLLGTGSDF